SKQGTVAHQRSKAASDQAGKEPKNRADILKVHLRSVNHDPTVLCDEWAARTDGWTGADLKALITNAQFDAMRNTSV
ncbi:hypothetical protein OSTOST_12570, partial [Ostertagia ostertagi]